MNRIRLTIIFIVLVCISIGSFYTYSATRAIGLPQYYLKKEAGNEKEAMAVTVAGSLTNGRTLETMKISTTGTKYASEQTFMEAFRRGFGTNDPSLDDYRGKYRSYMRGKQNIQSFNEDSTSLSYADVHYKVTSHGLQNLTFEISVLNKKSKAVTSFNEAVPKAERYNQMMVTDVQKNGQLLDLISQNYVHANDGPEAVIEIHHYQFDLKAKQLSQDDIILSSPAVETNTTYIVQKLKEPDETALSRYAVFAKDIQETNQKNSSRPDEKLTREFYAYDYQTRKINKVPFTQVQDSMTDLMTFDCYYKGDMIYFINKKDQNLEVTAFNLKKDMTVSNWKLKLPEPGSENRTIALINGNRLYLGVMTISNGKYKEPVTGNSYVWVTNLEGEVLYKGKLTAKGSKSSKKNYLEINSIQLEK